MRTSKCLILFIPVVLGALAVHSAGCALDTYGTLFQDSDAGADAATDADSGKGGEGGGGGGPVCGDHVKNAMEICDDADFGGATCKTLGFASGTLSCLADCSGFNTAACTTPPDCGNGTCGGTETCTSCPLDCGGCCGNGAIDPSELCDGAKLGGATCSSVLGSGYSGAVTCKSDCSGFDTTSCVPPATCGNGTKEAGESCDKLDLDTKTCLTIPGGFTGGVLSCKPDCTFNTAACTKCGNGTKEAGETCDGIDLGSKTCSTVPGGFTGGILSCKGDCSAFITTACTTCGNNLKEAGETCDGTDLTGKFCETIPGSFTGGKLACKGDCSAFETAGCLTLATCTSGDAGTVVSVTGSGTTSASLLVWASDGTEQDYTATTWATADITGKKLPGLGVVDGKGSAGFFTNGFGAVPLPQIWYMVDMATLPAAKCGGGATASVACRSAVAKSYRCQHAPYMENVGCPTPAVTFTEKPPSANISVVGADQLIVVALACP